MNINLKGKNALVGGSSKGIGKACAIVLSQMGANVTLVSRTEEMMIEVLDLLDDSQGQQHNYLMADFTDPADTNKRVKGLVATRPIHILVNNTGGPKGGPIVDAATDEFVQAFEKHVICNQLLSKAVLSGMIQEGYGRIINIISISVKEPIQGLGVSNTIRGAVASWAKTYANEVAKHGVTVNNVLPGYTATDRLMYILEKNAKEANISLEEQKDRVKQTIPLGRFADPLEIGQVVGFLASPSAAYITGVSLPVDGGRIKSI